MRRAASIANRLPRSVRRFLKRLPGAERARASLAGTPAVVPPEPGSLRPVVYLPTWATWDEMRQRPQYIVGAFATLGHAAYFVDPREPAPRRVGNVEIVPSLEHTPTGGVILYTHFAPVSSMFDRYDDAVVVYDILDDLSIYDVDEVGMPEHRKVRYHHPSIMERADVVLASAPALIEKHRVERPDIIYVENGVDPEAFGRRFDRPSDVAHLEGPLVGYHGMIARWFDFALLAHAATELRDATFVLVGPVDREVDVELSELVALPNVVYLGPRASDEIAGYVQSFDVGIVPFVVDDLTRAVSPLKMYEYMAAGVPVVSTPLPVAIAHPLVSAPGTAQEFVAAIRDTIVRRNEDPDLGAALRRAAREASWEHRLEPVIARLTELDLRTYRS
jgi:glycosyltransferase involved in cell wall biosynthesis